jgi:hypothetical protein
MEKHHNHFFLYFLAVGLAVAICVIFFTSFRKVSEVSAPTLVSADMPKKLPQEEPGKDEIVDIPSPDGKYALQMRNGHETGGTILQTFYITSLENETPIKIFSNLSPSDNLISVPYNTFSPTNKYVILKYKKSSENKYMVLRTDGKDILTDSTPVEITERFNEKFPDYAITDITGWGGYTVIVVNTNTKDGKTGPSWWFDMSNLSFIRLSTRFN